MKAKLHTGFLLLLFLGSISLNSCSRVTVSDRPNILWITSEDNSKHFMQLFDPNGAPTPHIESLAENGVIFTRAYSNAPVCSVARSTLISSCYAPRIGAQFHRKAEMVPMPDGIRMFPSYLRDIGYYTTNNSKEDYNIVKGDDVWDESSRKATWRNRAAGQPFFHVQNIGVTHESSLHFSEEEFLEMRTQTGPKKELAASGLSRTDPEKGSVAPGLTQTGPEKEYAESAFSQTDPDSVFVAAVHPETELFRYTYARYHDRIRQMDQKVGDILAQLEEDGLMDETIIFYFGDHGGVLPGSKGYLYETGLHVPLVVYIPEKYEKLAGLDRGSSMDGVVSFIDFGATVLNLAGADLPEGIDGKPFMGKGTSAREVSGRDFTFSYADRFDEKYDMVRSIRVGPYKYIRNFQPFNIDALQNNYRYRMLAYEQWRELFREGELTAAQSAFFLPKPVEALYNIEEDPYELNNLAKDPTYRETLEELRKRMQEHLAGMPDLSFYPEHVLADLAFDNPVAFGKRRKDEIGQLIRIADLSLLSFDAAGDALAEALDSDNPWKRYWGLIVCSSFGEDAGGLGQKIEDMARQDSEPLNRVRAAEYLALAGMKDPREVMLQALETSEDDIEILEILNAVTLLKDIGSPYAFAVEKKDITHNYKWNEIDSRIEYLGKVN